ncbi:hypothetical protein [Methylocella sp.]|uniref:hypothetical protein n=1 Tax=Methylocella sp. TaxID=1978226 RepID=UPI003C728B1D
MLDHVEQRRRIGVSRFASKLTDIGHKRDSTEIQGRRIDVEAARPLVKKWQTSVRRRRGDVQALAGQRGEPVATLR